MSDEPANEVSESSNTEAGTPMSATGVPIPSLHRANEAAYKQIISRVFFSHFGVGAREVHFERTELEEARSDLELKGGKNIGDVLYTYRFRRDLPDDIRNTAPDNGVWIIRLEGSGKYRFEAAKSAWIQPSDLPPVKVRGSTPGIIGEYALDDEQALLAMLRYNRLIDVFTGTVCHSLQSHLRTQIPDVGQTETDEIYVGFDKTGTEFVFPVQAKGKNDRLSIVQVDQDVAMAASKFPNLKCKCIGAKFMKDSTIALFLFEDRGGGAELVDEMRFEITDE